MKEEPVDILDEQGRKTGQTMLKSEAHRRGLWHGGAHLWIYNSKGEVLLQLRSPQKVVRPNIWDVSVAGHIQAGKTPHEMVIEEAKEELGLSIVPGEMQFIGNDKLDDILEPGHWNHRVYLWIYAVKGDGLDPSKLKLEEAETAAVKWLPLTQLEKDIKDPVTAANYAPHPSRYLVAVNEIPKLLEQ